MNKEALFLQLPILLFSVIAHEISHGWAALKCGDDTALRMGRITFNPLPHIDVVGSLMLPIFAVISNAPMIGWAKPVPVNPLLFNNPRRDSLLVSAAGPAMNFIIAFTASLLFRAVISFGGFEAVRQIAALEILKFTIIINILLGVFNLMPIPPLDGSKIVSFFLPRPLAVRYENIGFFGIIIVFALLFSGALGIIILPVVRIITGVFLYKAL